VSVFPDRLTAFDLGLEDIFDALKDNNLNRGGGYIVHAGEQRLVRGSALIKSLDELREVVVATRAEGTPVRIGDVADVRLAPLIRQGAVTRDGRGEVVTGVVMMLMGENSREVSSAVDDKIREIAPTLPKGITLDTLYDRTDLVDRTVRTVATNLIEGGVLVIVVLLLLLGNLRGGLLVAAAIPLSMLATFIAMNYFGVSGNLMSLGALDFGLIVDGSVVLVEHVVLALAVPSRPGESVTTTVVRAGKEVARPVAFAVAIIMIVYVPILSLRGIEGKMFQPMAFTVIFALFASLVLALTFMPAMSAVVFRGGLRAKDTWLHRQIKRGYLPSLAWAMKRRFVVIAFALLSLGGAVATVPFLGAEFIPRLDEGAIALQAVRLPSVPLDQSVRYATLIEETLLDHFPDEIDTVVSRTGRAEIATDPMGIELSDIFVMLKPEDGWTKAEDKQELVAAMRKVLMTEVPGQRYLFSQPIELRTNELISGVRADVAIKIYGDNIAELARLAEKVEKVVRSVHGAGDVEAEQASGLPFLKVEVDREAISRYGVSSRKVMNAVATVAGHPVGEIFEGQRRFTLQVRLSESARQTVAALRAIPIRTPSGTVPLGELAELSFEEGPAHIGRENVRRRVAIMTNVRGRDLAGFVADAKARIAKDVELPPGYVIEWGGQFKNLKEASARLAIAVPAALVLIFLLLYMTFGSSRIALLIYLNVPFAAVGGVFALGLRGLPLSISAGVGFIALFGIAVLNGVVLVSHIRRLQREGVEISSASETGAQLRLRAVLMTALTDGIGFLPMA
ncbi:MAG: CusA/CzcA family heavy metal efflux RND transporter, partial [Deltaproteobacteria bacterium]|nr:CusA/CzcA family heavy metal efflux RND transporter [Deltaproteobacteria bacterium]